MEITPCAKKLSFNTVAVRVQRGERGTTRGKKTQKTFVTVYTMRAGPHPEEESNTKDIV